MDSGYSITPGQGPRTSPRFNPQQSEALKVLSLRLPGRVSGRPIAPERLLRPGLSSGPGPTTAMQTTGAPPTAAPSFPALSPGLPTGGEPRAPLQVSNLGAPASPFAAQQPDMGAFASLLQSLLGAGPGFAEPRKPTLHYGDNQNDVSLPGVPAGPTRPGYGNGTQTPGFEDFVNDLFSGSTSEYGPGRREV